MSKFLLMGFFWYDFVYMSEDVTPTKEKHSSCQLYWAEYANIMGYLIYIQWNNNWIEFLYILRKHVLQIYFSFCRLFSFPNEEFTTVL